MKVVLIIPNSDAPIVTPSLGVGYLASAVRQHGHEAAILDLAKNRINASKGVRLLAEMKPDVIGISILSSAYGEARELVRGARQVLPNTPVVVGGAHVTALPEDSLKDLDVDLGVRGEAEQVLPALVDQLAAGKDPAGSIPSICRLRDGKVVCSERAGFVKDLDSLPFPAWDLMDPRTYSGLPHLLHRKSPVAPVMTSRGCPFDCTFCASTTLWGKGWRTRSAQNVVDEIELLVRDYGVKEIHIEDDNFTLKKSHAAAICEEIIRRRLDIVWCTPNGVRIDTLDKEMVELMKRSGCYGLGFGIESGSQQVLDLNHKRLDLGKVASVVDMVRRHGIETDGFFILGLPGETVDTMRETLSFALRLPLDRANFSLLAPLPGSDIFEKYVRGNAGRKIDYEVFTYFKPFPLGKLDAATLKRWQRRSAFRFYARPRQIWNLLRHNSPRQIAEMLKAIYFRR